jgi:hypothetical protein
MPHQCVRCHKIYEDGSEEILKGCECGGKLFFYIKKSALDKATVFTEELTNEDKEQIEQDILNIMDIDSIGDVPVVLDFESINVVSQGKFELDLVNLFKKDPLIYRLSDGKYFIDLPQTFRSSEKERKEREKPDATVPDADGTEQKKKKASRFKRKKKEAKTEQPKS